MTTSTIIESIFAGRDNVFSLQLIRGGVPINLLAIVGYELYLSNGRVFKSTSRITSLDDLEGGFVEKDNGVVEINIGPLLTGDDLGKHTAYLVTFDLVNTQGVQWPNFKLKVN